MKVFVVGATGAVGVPTVRRLVGAGHEVVGMTRSDRKQELLQQLGATAAIGDALEPHSVERAVAAAAPEAMISLLTSLPKRGPTSFRHLRANARVHRNGTANVVSAATKAGVKKIVAESVIFRYGYGDLAPMLTEDAPAPDALSGGLGQAALDGLRALEKTVLGAGGIVLRYGVFYGPAAGHQEFMARMLRRGMMRTPGGDLGSLSWIHVEDAAAATVAALERGRPGEIYNVCDDEPASFAAFARELATAIDAKPPRAVPLAVARVVMPYAVLSMTSTITMSNAKAKRELGWAPRYPSIREGLRAPGAP